MVEVPQITKNVTEAKKHQKNVLIEAFKIISQNLLQKALSKSYENC